MPHIGNFPVPAFPRPLSIGPSAFIPSQDTYDWDITQLRIQNRTSLNNQIYFAPVYLPHKAKVTKLTLYGYRDDELSVFGIQLLRLQVPAGSDIMAMVGGYWTNGNNSGSEDTIAYSVIDNVNCHYAIFMNLNPNDDVLDCKFQRVVIDWK